MLEPVETRVIEVCEGEWVAQFAGGLNGWMQLGDETFATQAEAESFLQEQIDTADFGDEE